MKGKFVLKNIAHISSNCPSLIYKIDSTGQELGLQPALLMPYLTGNNNSEGTVKLVMLIVKYNADNNKNINCFSNHLTIGQPDRPKNMPI